MPPEGPASAPPSFPPTRSPGDVLHDGAPDPAAGDRDVVVIRSHSDLRWMTHRTPLPDPQLQERRQVAAREQTKGQRRRGDPGRCILRIAGRLGELSRSD